MNIRLIVFAWTNFISQTRTHSMIQWIVSPPLSQTSLEGLNTYKEVQLSSTIDIARHIGAVLKVCCVQAPLNKIPREVFEATIRFLNEYYTMPPEDIILKSSYEFLKHIDNLKAIFENLLSWRITENKSNNIELLYWLMQSDEVELVTDLQKIKNKQSLSEKHRGILWLLEQMGYKARGIIKKRLELLYESFKHPL